VVADWDWHNKAKKHRKSGDLQAAEEIYVSVGEQPSDPRSASSAPNSLAYSILIPQERFVEARLWLQNSIDMEAGWESWNSLENLGLCEYFAGNNELAARYLQQVVDAGDGPVDEAREYLTKIQSGDFAPPTLHHDLSFNSEWEDFDISGPVDPKSTQRQFYLRLIKYMSHKGQQFDEDSFIQSSGASVTGFANGMVTGKLLEYGLTRNAAAQAGYDYVHYVFLNNNPQEDPFEAGVALWDSGKKDKALGKLRIAAREGNAMAMLMVARGVETLYNRTLSLPWYRLALANGAVLADSEISLLRKNEESASDIEFDDDEVDEHEDDSSSAHSGSKVCTNCGSARDGDDKFCSNCGEPFDL
jgi:tetratricopeptide (TPR) repeat protein